MSVSLPPIRGRAGRAHARAGPRRGHRRRLGTASQASDSDPLHPEIHAVAASSFRLRQPPEIRGSGYVAKSLEAALWAFHDAGDYRETVLKAANLDDDSDTTAAVCGQLAGAY